MPLCPDQAARPPMSEKPLIPALRDEVSPEDALHAFMNVDPEKVKEAR